MKLLGTLPTGQNSICPFRANFVRSACNQMHISVHRGCPASPPAEGAGEGTRRAVPNGRGDFMDLQIGFAKQSPRNLEPALIDKHPKIHAVLVQNALERSRAGVEKSGCRVE